MRFHEITSISGMGGLFRMDVQRSNGLVVHSLTEGWTRFVSSRKHLFTPLDNIAIYTDDDTVPLVEVMLTMRDKAGSLPPPDAKASPEAFKDYMEAIVPSYDRDKVYVSDMKKLVRWFGILEEHGVLEAEKEARAEEASAEGEAPAEGNESAPDAVKPKKPAKAKAVSGEDDAPAKPAKAKAAKPAAAKAKKATAKGGKADS
jgi:hypothetical protein